MQLMSLERCLVIGGTGMLSEVSLDFAQREIPTSVIGRTRSKMDLLLRNAGSSARFIDPLILDYANTADLRSSLEGRLAAGYRYSVCIAWIHSHAAHALKVVAEILAGQDQDCQLIHVCGSASNDPSTILANVEHQRIYYKRVLLGFKVEGGRSRWLTDREISQGILASVGSDLDTFVVGQIEPWNERP